MNDSAALSDVSMVVRQGVHDLLAGAGLRGGNLLVALSGGCDSVCLLHLLHERIVADGGTLEVCHVDHGLRPGSAADAEFCRQLARAADLAFHLRILTADDFGRGDGVQAEARRHRRAFFRELLERRRLDAVALGHHADDQVETVLYRLLRGAGLRGLGGMRPWAPPFVRPLLGARRVQLTRLAEECGWQYRDDASNQRPEFARNRLRLEVIPRLRQAHPGAEEALLRFSRLAADDEDCLSSRAREVLGRLGRVEPEGLALPVASLRQEPIAIRRRVYLAAWERVGGRPGILSAAHLETVDDLLGAGKAHRIAPLPGPTAFAVSYGDLWALKPGMLRPPAVAVRLARVGEERVVPGVARVGWSTQVPEGVSGVGIPAGRAANGLELRSRRDGDWLDAGDGRRRKVKDLLQRSRCPLWRRRRVLVAEDEAGVFGLIGPDRAWGPNPAAAGFVWARWEQPAPR